MQHRARRVSRPSAGGSAPIQPFARASPKARGELLMNSLKMAAVAAAIALAAPALAQTPPAAAPPPPDFSKVEIKTTDLGDNVYMLEGQGGNITVAVAREGIIMVDGESAPPHART